MRKLANSELNRLSVAEFRATEKLPVVVVLDNVRSAHNVGSVFRTADAFLVEQVYLCGITACPPSRDIRKTALGASDSVTWKYVENTLDALQNLKEQGYQLIAIEQAEGSITLQKFEPKKTQKYALIFGHEVNGVSEAVMKMVDDCIEIPQLGTKHSLNISVSVGVVLWDFFRQLVSQE